MRHQHFVQLAVVAITASVSQAAAEVPIACNLKALTSQQRVELGRLSDRLVAAIVRARDLPEGYAFELNPKLTAAAEVGQLIDLWRRCCPFYEFRLDLHGQDGSLWFSLTGRKGVKEYIPVDAPKLAAKLPR